MADREVVIVDGARTAFGRMGGAIKDILTAKLAGIALKGLVEKTGVTEKASVDSVFMGAALHCSTAINPARWAALDAGLGYETSASYIEMQCGSAIDSINHAAWKMLCGQADIIIAGGMESYSQAFAKFSMATPSYRLAPPMPITPQLTPSPEDNISMGETAEKLAEIYSLSREASDEFAYNSQMRAAAAMEAGLFDEEIVPVALPAARKTPEAVFKVDEHPRADTTMDGLAQLRPAFKKDGVVTAGSASGRNDGAAFVLMMTAEKAAELGYAPYAKWIGGGDHGVDPRVMGIGPAYAIPKALKMAGITLGQVDIMECNEAFAVQNLAVAAELENQTGVRFNMDNWNPMGGAIALGHPNGASGARIAMFAMKEMARRNAKYAVFSSCCGGGLGVAAVLENLR